jgi:hypothetical protein
VSKLISSHWQEFPPILAARFGVKAGKQRSMFHEGHLVLVLHLPPTANEVERRATIFWRHPNGTWKSSGEAKGGLGALKSLVESYVKEGTRLDAALESARTAGDYFKILQDVTPLLRAVRGTHRVMQEARELLKTDSDMIALRDSAYEAERTAELVQQDAKAGMDFTVARRAEEQAELQDRIAKSSHKLNLITALFLPVTALSGVLGANLSHGLENTATPYLFWGFVAAAFILGFSVRATVARTR